MRLRELIPLVEGMLAALKHNKTGKLLVAKPNYGHYSLIDGDIFKNLSSYTHGFVTPEGKFLDRKKATAYAEKNKHIHTSAPWNKVESGGLHSFNLKDRVKS